jgi:hypothetical protein
MKEMRGFDTLVLLTAWLLWKQWNARVFNNMPQQCSVPQLVVLITEEFNA